MYFALYDDSKYSRFNLTHEVYFEFLRR